MGAELAIIDQHSGAEGSGMDLDGFTDDQIVARIRLDNSTLETSWLLMGRVFVTNFDDDPQFVRVKIFRGFVDRELNSAEMRINFRGNGGDNCLTVFAVLQANLPIEDVQLRCSTFNGRAWGATLVALQVNEVRFAG
jgi:hypothetical protein